MNYLTNIISSAFSLTGRNVASKFKGGIYSKKSSLYLARNAIGSFTVPGTGVTQDSRGNYIVNTEQLQYTFYLVEEIDNEETNYPGVDRVSDKLIGYVVFPSKLDPRIKTGTKGVLTFGTQRETKFTVIDLKFNYGSTGAIGGILQKVLGDSIYLQQTI